jgi:hypothetical protein
MRTDIFSHECGGKVFRGLLDLAVWRLVVVGRRVFAMTAHCVVRLQTQ